MPLEYTDVVSDPLFLVLRYTLSDPSDVPNFLADVNCVSWYQSS
jgi:hypothetical protein